MTWIGVVADFDGQIKLMYGDTFDNLGQDAKNKFWHRDFDPNFFNLLKPAPGLNKLIDVGMELFNGNVRFLTALPQARKDLAGQCIHTKNRWARIYAPNIPVTFGPFAIDKQRHCRGRRYVLIDDNKQNIAQWLDTGGQAIYHKDINSIESTIEQLYKLDLCDVQYAGLV